MKLLGHCKEDDGCIAGCVTEINDCKLRSLVWKDNSTCVPDSSCSCVSHTGEIIPVSFYKPCVI